MFFNINNQEISDIEKEENFPHTAEYIFSLVFMFFLSFIASQKLLPLVADSIQTSICQSELQVPYISCDVMTKSTSPNTNFISGMELNNQTKTLRRQFTSLPNLESALQKLQWKGGDDQHAARFMSVMTALENGRDDSSGIPASLSSMLDDLWKSHPDIVSTSHCLSCNHFYNNVLKPFFKSGNENRALLKTIASGHPRFLQAISESGALNDEEISSIAILQAELLDSRDAQAAAFIGSKLKQNENNDGLHRWATKGWNGSYAVGKYPHFLNVDKHIIIDAWQRGIVKGANNAELTRYLISIGYRPALRWLLWVYAGDFEYFNNYIYREQRDRYFELILNLHTEFPVNSKNDLIGFYNKFWKQITWDPSSSKWVIKNP